ncbi:ubiquinol oxidase subunit II [Candidatus Neptunochlamydia vexilliferae]|uniref:Ubiquinol oxidase polypeptide II n=1 Tax=Candidatus Neptunichlamydia vexilliferae TaxID=1651774 RepID=A0ABS0AXG1_9BACT|nr:ubiquinol oxidase subunit II [Candidatus Neptunochlamydia vexilliferae]MBF5058827.1 Cytochrome bo(3) ubiquinol oxidase subunit 2 [Candidatus Neptunochlamydia vexilliferae]
MKKAFKITFAVLFIIVSIGLLALYISNHDVAVLSPKGMVGKKERELIITSASLMLAVVIPVLILAGVFAWRYRASRPKGKHAPNWEHNNIAELCWWGVPIVIVTILSVIIWKTSHELNPSNPIDTGKKTLKIQVVALNWKWLFIYPEQGIATVNFVQFPEKTPIAFEITADAPMNSFWIPQLGGQIYAMPAVRTELHLIADEEGEFMGRSSNISGKGFAGMVFMAKSSSEGEFYQWVQSVKQSNHSLGISQYEGLVKPSEYDPPAFYMLTDQNLFDYILEKYQAR